MGKLGNINLETVEEVSVRLLQQKSKDLRVLAFLSFVYLRKDDWERFSDIFDGMATLTEQNYDGLFPDRDRAKQMALKWLSEDRFSDLLNDKNPSENDYEHISRLSTVLGKIKPILEQKFPDGSPFPSNLYKNSQKWERTCKPKPKEAPPAKPSNLNASGNDSTLSAATSPAQQNVSLAASTGGNTESMETPKQAQGIAKKAASFLIAQEPQKVMGIRIMRSLRWDLLEKAPPSNGGKTQLTGPNPQQRTYFQNLLAKNDWKTAVVKAESVFASGGNHLWLDLQRIISTSCNELGEAYTPIRKAVLFETAYLLKRIPDISSLLFSDGQPFCDDATKDWIESEVKSALGSSNGSATPAIKNKNSIDEEQKKANALAATGKIEDALDLIQKGIRDSGSERDNFKRSILIGNLLLKAKQPDIAISVLEASNQKAITFNLDKWEPELAVEAWEALMKAYKAGKVQKPQNIQLTIQEKQNIILSKISQIDPRKALLLNK